MSDLPASTKGRAADAVAAVDGAAAAPAPPHATLDGRGTTSVADSVIEKIASQAASEVEHVQGVVARTLGVSRPGGRRARPQVTARIDGHLARLSVAVGIRYPAPIRRVSAQVREQVVSAVGRLAAIDVREVDIDIVALAVDPTDRQRVR